MKKTFYITTPIFYPNDIPHLGHAYTMIAADTLARWNKLTGKNVYFLTGTDEHGKKIQKAALAQKQQPKEFLDAIVPEFKQAWKKLNIDYDFFIRTTDKAHEKIVQEVLQKVYDNGDIYKGKYEGFYCTACEAYYTEKDAPGLKCPIHKKALDKLSEESYFFKLSKYQDFLLKHYEKNKNFIQPSHRRQEIINRVSEELKDFSISRTSFDWGIPLAFDKKHYCYVWFDALLNYYSATRTEKRMNKFWPADIHIIGKDILWFHAVYWPAMLKSAGLDLPTSIFAHGWLTVNNEKMGKSAGNAISIDSLINIAGVDSARYFLLRETPFGEDGDFSQAMLQERHNNELANKLGNLVSRVSALAEKYGLGKEADNSLSSKETQKKVIRHMERYELDKALHEIFSFLDRCNEHVQHKKPWETHDAGVLYELTQAIRDASILLSPFLPETAEKIAQTFGFKLEWNALQKPLKISKITKSKILFKKI